MSYCRCYYHIVFATKERRPLLNTLELRRQVHYILYKLCTNKSVQVLRIGGYVEHVHLLLNVPPTIAISELVQYIKVNSSACIKEKHIVPMWMGWADGYGCFTLHYELVDTVYHYIMGQVEHHRTHDFIDEYTDLLKRNGVSDVKLFLPQ